VSVEVAAVPAGDASRTATLVGLGCVKFRGRSLGVLIMQQSLLVCGRRGPVRGSGSPGWNGGAAGCRRPRCIRRRRISHVSWNRMRNGSSQPRTTGSHRPATGNPRSGRLRAGGTASAIAWRTVRRCTRYLSESSRIDAPADDRLGYLRTAPPLISLTPASVDVLVGHQRTLGTRRSRVGPNQIGTPGPVLIGNPRLTPRFGPGRPTWVIVPVPHRCVRTPSPDSRNCPAACILVRSTATGRPALRR